ncbi:RNA polymerase sigma factor [Saccharomonospora cyanea]|uniref:RNA polymerase sigma factor, sigma-70 family n=1 Tax=Saccharomonospora cyanea NA-134 TaxID=882082 RepID=H5XN05_9PSEU|nr:RNA polymerase sigma factor, sigma-70 family [Saccharomonospora cyanea NA-134]
MAAVPDSGGGSQPEPISEHDGELWRRAAHGDEGAFTELFHRHAEAVWNHAYRLSGSWATAEDVTSSTFVTAWRKCADVTLVNDSARPWLYAVAANLARTHGRGERRLLRLRRVLRAEVAHDHADDVTDRLADASKLRRVVEAVGTLPKSQRRAAELCLLGDLSFAEAAAVLGIAEVTVRSQISRARARLRTTLEQS